MASKTPLILSRPQRGHLDGRTETVEASTPVLELRGVRRVFRLAGTELKVLNGVDLDLRTGEIVGAGRPVGRREIDIVACRRAPGTPRGGAVLIGGEDCGSLSDERRTLLRRSEIGFVYQFHHLLPESRHSKMSCCRR